MAGEAAQFRSEVLRTADRLRGMGGDRIARTPDLVLRVRGLIERIATATSSMTNHQTPVPEVLPYGLADQLVVLGTELADLADQTEVAELAELSAALLVLRRGI